jgi:hypothetical protein
MNVEYLSSYIMVDIQAMISFPNHDLFWGKFYATFL